MRDFMLLVFVTLMLIIGIIGTIFMFLGIYHRNMDLGFWGGMAAFAGYAVFRFAADELD